MDAQIALADGGRVPAIAAMTARALIDDPLLRWPLGDVADPLPAIEEEFLIIQTIAADCGCLWEAGDAIGAASWIEPELAAQFWEQAAAAAVGRGIAAHATDGGDRNRRLWEWIAAQYGREPAWFLDVVGVDPLRQGNGVGSLLIEHGLERAREQALPAVLETSNPRLVGYYERFGFTVEQHADAPDGGPHVWFMRCDAAERHPDAVRVEGA